MIYLSLYETKLLTYNARTMQNQAAFSKQTDFGYQDSEALLVNRHLATGRSGFCQERHWGELDPT